ncbi:Hypothetical predicted protein, partial [Scomber scombrus]
LNVRVSVHKVDADQLLAAVAFEARQTLTHRSSRLLQAGGAVLTLSQLAERRRRKGHLTKLTTEDRGKTPLLIMLMFTFTLEMSSF